MPEIDIVRKVFDKVAIRYDLMNDLMSFGLHRLWKDKVMSGIQPQNGQSLLDVAGGTGDMAFRFLDRGGGNVTVVDINQNMLDVGKARAIDSGSKKYLENIKWINADVVLLPFDDNIFDCCTLVFGVRNFYNIDDALKEIIRVLKPGGKFMCLEFDNGDFSVFTKIFDLYSSKILPLMGKIVIKDEMPYQYLAKSIKEFPKRESFIKMLIKSGFHNLKVSSTFPPVANIYSAYKII